MRNFPLTFITEATQKTIANTARAAETLISSDKSPVSLAAGIKAAVGLVVCHIFDVRNFDGPYWLAHLERELAGQNSRRAAPLPSSTAGLSKERGRGLPI